MNDSIIKNISQPGLWVVKSMQTCRDISEFIYEMVYKGGVSVDIFSTNKKDIQNEVIAMIRQDYIDNASDENERNWLEQEMAEYNTHGFFWYPEEMNDYVSNGLFWANYAIIHEDNVLIHSNCVNSIALVDGIEKLWLEKEIDIPRIFKEIDSDAKDHKKTVLVFLSDSLLKRSVFDGVQTVTLDFKLTKMEKKTFGELWELLDHCEKDSNEEFEIYKRMVELSEKEIAELEDDDEEDLLELPTGETVRCVPDFLDNYAGAMDSLALIYIRRKEYAKALPLLEQVLPIYRTLEIFNPNYTYQRVYATERLVECLKELGKKNLAILYGYELKHLRSS